jgi:hypothetical protein
MFNENLIIALVSGATGALLGGGVLWAITVGQARREKRERQQALARFLLAEIRRILAELYLDVYWRPGAFDLEEIELSTIHSFARPAIERAGELNYTIVADFLALDGLLGEQISIRARYGELLRSWQFMQQARENNVRRRADTTLPPEERADADEMHGKLEAQTVELDEQRKDCIRVRERAVDLCRLLVHQTAAFLPPALPMRYTNPDRRLAGYPRPSELPGEENPMAVLARERSKQTGGL